MATSNTTTKAPAATKAGGVASGMRRVQVSYSADKPETVGHVVDLAEADARTAVDQGRARYVAESTKLGKQDGKPELVETPEPVESVTAASNDGPLPGQA